jgi:hypothetical protein
LRSTGQRADVARAQRIAAWPVRAAAIAAAFLDRLAESRVGADATTSLPATNTLNLEDGRSL